MGMAKGGLKGVGWGGVGVPERTEGRDYLLRAGLFAAAPRIFLRRHVSMANDDDHD